MASAPSRVSSVIAAVSGTATASAAVFGAVVPPQPEPLLSEGAVQSAGAAADDCKPDDIASSVDCGSNDASCWRQQHAHSHRRSFHRWHSSRHCSCVQDASECCWPTPLWLEGNLHRQIRARVLSKDMQLPLETRPLPAYSDWDGSADEHQEYDAY